MFRELRAERGGVGSRPDSFPGGNHEWMPVSVICFYNNNESTAVKCKQVYSQHPRQLYFMGWIILTAKKLTSINYNEN